MSGTSTGCRRNTFAQTRATGCLCRHTSKNDLAPRERHFSCTSGDFPRHMDLTAFLKVCSFRSSRESKVFDEKGWRLSIINPTQRPQLQMSTAFVAWSKQICSGAIQALLSWAKSCRRCHVSVGVGTVCKPMSLSQVVADLLKPAIFSICACFVSSRLVG